LLRELGFEILERQPRRSFCFVVDGEEVEVEVRPDLIVRRRGRTLIAEVKTGKRAPRLETRATRRQLLEYRVACSDTDGVLLVDMEAARVREVGFSLDERRDSIATKLVIAALLGATAGAIAVWWLGAGPS
jgi:hypothetical protein